MTPSAVEEALFGCVSLQLPRTIPQIKKALTTAIKTKGMTIRIFMRLGGGGASESGMSFMSRSRMRLN